MTVRLSSSRTGCTLLPRKCLYLFPVLIYVENLVSHRPIAAGMIMYIEENAVSLSGIGPATFRVVIQCFNHYATTCSVLHYTYYLWLNRCGYRGYRRLCRDISTARVSLVHSTETDLFKICKFYCKIKSVKAFLVHQACLYVLKTDVSEIFSAVLPSIFHWSWWWKQQRFVKRWSLTQHWQDWSSENTSEQQEYERGIAYPGYSARQKICNLLRSGFFLTNYFTLKIEAIFTFKTPV